MADSRSSLLAKTLRWFYNPLGTIERAKRGHHYAIHVLEALPIRPYPPIPQSIANLDYGSNERWWHFLPADFLTYQRINGSLPVWVSRCISPTQFGNLKHRYNSLKRLSFFLWRMFLKESTFSKTMPFLKTYLVLWPSSLTATIETKEKFPRKKSVDNIQSLMCMQLSSP